MLLHNLIYRLIFMEVYRKAGGYAGSSQIRSSEKVEKL